MGALSTGASTVTTEACDLVLTWGVLAGLASGCVAVVLGAAIVNRWFTKNRGLVMGLLTASAATGTLVFLPALAAIAEAGGWRPVVLTVAAVMAALGPLESGRAHAGTPVTNAHLVCRLLLEYKKYKRH